MADEQVTRRPQQIVLDLKWTEGGQEKRELFGPWIQGDPETEEGGLAHLTAAHAFLGEWCRSTGRAEFQGTVILVNDPGEWVQARERQADADNAYITRGIVPASELREMQRGEQKGSDDD